MLDGDSKQIVSHDRIVKEVLPSFADKLKKEGLISSYDRKPFTVNLSNDWPSVRIYPDLVLHLPNGRRILVEIINPRNPKRFIGEIVYPHLLRYYKQIDDFIFFVLHSGGQAHLRGMVQKTVFTEVFGAQFQVHSIGMTWAKNEDINYRNLRYILKSRFLESRT